MSCTICTKTKPIPQCSGILTIGEIAPTAAVVVIEDVITERRITVDGTVTGGILTIDIDPLAEFISPNLVYNMEVYESIEDYGTPLPVTIGEEEYACLNLTVQSIKNADGEIEGADEITLQIDA